MSSILEKMDVFHKSTALADEISVLVESLPAGTYYLAAKLKHAASSLVANIAEGNGRWHTAERKSFLSLARGSAQECAAILEVCRQRKLIPDGEYRRLKEILERIAKMIGKLIDGLAKATREMVG